MVDAFRPDGQRAPLRAELDIRTMLRRYRQAVAELAEAEPRREAEERAVEEAIAARELDGGPRRTSAEVDADNARLDAFVARYHDPVDAALGRLRALACLMHDVDPHAAFDRPRAVLADGAVVVVLDRAEDPRNLGVAVVEPGDVLFA